MGSVSVILQKLAPYIEKEVELFLHHQEEADTLKSKLKRVQEGLQDAERQAVTNSNVEGWFRELRDVVHEMDDALDEWKTKKLELEVEQSEDDDISGLWEKVRSRFLSLCLCFKHKVGCHKIAREMNALSGKLDKILLERNKYNFVSDNSNNSREFEKPESTSVVDKSKVFGRGSDVDSLVELLLSRGEQNGSRVISIVGEGGIGKTTLAQLVYSDDRVENRFDLRAWVSVPDPFDASKVAKTILEVFGENSSGEHSGEPSLETLGRRIKAVVSKQNFLLVLDNVWTVDSARWESLKKFFVAEPGCRILVTTRDEVAARTMGATHCKRLNILSHLDCARILNKIALEGRSEEEHEKFCQIGFEIAKKCKGLPLAAKTTGSMLSSRYSVQEWVDVQESPLWVEGDKISETFRALRLSYMDLSPTLKCCFLSCVLMEGSVFDAVELIKIWMAQCYISSSATWAQVESKGMEIIRKLYMRSFFEQVRQKDHFDGGIICEMHDVMREFASYLSTTERYLILENRTHDTPIESIERTRNFCIRSGCLEDLPSNFIRLLKCVRVLCLSHCGLEELFEEVGKLIHLRYLDLSWNPIRELPETMCDLYNLQTLDLQRCDALSRLPHGIGKLKNLRHLLFPFAFVQRMEYPRGLEKLTGLWTLNEFRATRDSVGYLRNLNQLSRRLHIFVEGLNEAGDAEKANLRGKIHMKELTLYFSEDVSMDAIEAMVPPSQIQTLFIIGGPNKQLPRWITSTSTENLIKLGISNFGACSFLPSLRNLPSLEHLSLGCMNITRLIRLEFLGIIQQGGTTSAAVAEGGFSKLKILDFWRCKQWEEWEDVEATATHAVPILPCLKKLEFTNCPKLKALPLNLLLHVAPSLHNLTINNCDWLESRYHKEFGADRDKISHIPDVRIGGMISDLMEHLLSQSPHIPGIDIGGIISGLMEDAHLLLN